MSLHYSTDPDQSLGPLWGHPCRMPQKTYIQRHKWFQVYDNRKVRKGLCAWLQPGMMDLQPRTPAPHSPSRVMGASQPRTAHHGWWELLRCKCGKVWKEHQSTARLQNIPLLVWVYVDIATKTNLKPERTIMRWIFSTQDKKCSLNLWKGENLFHNTWHITMIHFVSFLNDIQHASIVFWDE